MGCSNVTLPWTTTAENVSDFMDLNYSSIDTSDAGLVDTTIGFYLYRIITPVVLAFGVLGNISNLAVLRCKTFRRRLNTIERCALRGLITLAVSDLVFCVVGIPAAFLPSGALAPADDVYLVVGFYYGLYRLPLINTCLFASTWLIVWISMERYLAVCHPFQARIAIRTRRSIGAYVGICVVAIAINFPLYFKFDVTKADACYTAAPSVAWRSNPGLVCVFRVLWAVLGTFVPFCLLTFCNLSILRAVCRTDLSESPGGKTSSRVTVTLIVMVFMYLLLVSPSMVVTFLANYVSEMSDSQYTNFTLAIYVTNFCQAVKFSSNFLLYCVTNKEFRRDVKGKGCNKSSSRATLQDTSTFKHYQLVGKSRHV